MNDAERAVILAKAARAGLRPGVYLREAGRGARLGRKVNDAAYHALSRIGNNINQLAHWANIHRCLPEASELAAALAEVFSLRSQL